MLRCGGAVGADDRDGAQACNSCCVGIRKREVTQQASPILLIIWAVSQLFVVGGVCALTQRGAGALIPLRVFHPEGENFDVYKLSQPFYDPTWQ